MFVARGSSYSMINCEFGDSNVHIVSFRCRPRLEAHIDVLVYTFGNENFPFLPCSAIKFFQPFIFLVKVFTGSWVNKRSST
ncbi:hypothetical protein SCLCIDRAFT_254719 [Scleroderma citrinum Foug A]|uniref:Uncharacterized protein n=1 Tax=Scleroderma citrinum Foug A TaxID=1036808 RepID=A0A0C3EER5_9AGAM|nr:hypothetical protein SCLCIDRAFT_254719 [Scleroderma citrinum Foug A]